MRRRIVVLAGLAAAAVVLLAALRWRDIAVRVQMRRLAGDPKLRDAWLLRPADSIEGRAARTFFRERPEELARRYLAAMAFDGFPRIEDLQTAEIQIGPDGGEYSYRLADGSRAAHMQMSGLKDPAKRLFDVALSIRGQAMGLDEHPGMRFAFEKGVLRCFRDEPVRPEDEVPPWIGWHSSQRSAVWTGKEALLFASPNGVALDPATGRWRVIRGHPSRPHHMFRSVAMSDGRVICAFAKESVAFDLYRVADDSWEPIGEVGPESVEDLDPKRSGTFFVLGGVRMDDGAIFFLSRGASLFGFRVGPAGIRRISSDGAPRDDGFESYWSAVHAFGTRMLVWADGGGIWDAGTDRWERVLERAGPSSFADCAIGEEVVIVGGCWALAISARDGSRREIHLPDDLPIGTDPRAVAAGNTMFVWLSKVDGEAQWCRAGLLDVRTGAWRPIPATGDPAPRESPTCLWTGKEVLVLGGMNIGQFFTDAWAFDPAAMTWRRLDNFPRCREHAAEGAAGER